MSLISRRALRALGLVVALAALVITPAAVAEDGGAEILGQLPGVDATIDETHRLWFVEIAPGAKAAFRADAAAEGIQLQERFSFNRLWHGVSVEVSPAQVGRLAALDGVTAVFPVLPATVGPLAPIQPDMQTAIAMTGADIAQSELGLTGRGVRVAVMDTGVDYHHPDLGGCFGPGCRVETGWDFVGDFFNASTVLGTPELRAVWRNINPDPDPDDCNGHGTHVAGIIGARPSNPDGVRGVAPNVTFGAYRVFGCEGSTLADIMIAAMERALADDMDILNMSIGSAFMTWPQYPTAEAADRLVEAGMVVVASIGNSGTNGVYSAGAPGVGRNVIGVASIDNTHVNAYTFLVNPSGRRVPYLPMASTTAPPTVGESPEVVYVGRGCAVLNETTTPPVPTGGDPYLADPAGKIALIDRGVCTFNEKYQRAVQAGAVGVIIANNAPGLFTGGGIEDKGPFAIAISQEDGNAIKAQLQAGRVTLTWTNVRVNAPNPTGGLASSFTSYGLTAELDVKPDIAAPGGLIRSTFPLEKGGYQLLSGTSMAAPHVAGAAALFLEARPGTPPLVLREMLQNSADPVPFALARQFLAPVHIQGAGMLDIDDSVRAAVRTSPGKIVLGEGNGGTVTLTLFSSASTAVEYTLSHVTAVATTGSANAPTFTIAPNTVTFSQNTVLVPAGGTATVTATIRPGAYPNLTQYGGYIVLTPSTGTTATQILRVPYAGLTGDYQSMQILTEAGCGMPFLAKIGGVTDCAGGRRITGFTRQPDDALYSREGAGAPVVLFHLEHQARRVELHVLDATTGQRLGLFYAQDFWARNSTATAFYTITWNGTVQAVDPERGAAVRNLPNGSYKLLLRVQKPAALNEPNTVVWEEWISPTIRLGGVGTSTGGR
jgi:minor extracellular serine protease Vpr